MNAAFYGIHMSYTVNKVIIMCNITIILEYNWQYYNDCHIIFPTRAILQRAVLVV